MNFGAVRNRSLEADIRPIHVELSREKNVPNKSWVALTFSERRDWLTFSTESNCGFTEESFMLFHALFKLDQVIEFAIPNILGPIQFTFTTKPNCLFQLLKLFGEIKYLKKKSQNAGKREAENYCYFLIIKKCLNGYISNF